MKTKTSKVKSAINTLAVDIAKHVYFIVSEDVDSEDVELEYVDSEDVESQNIDLTKLCLKDVK